MITHQVFAGFIILYYKELEDPHMREQQIMYNLKKKKTHFLPHNIQVSSSK